ncbi:MAG: hypothetical protein N2572_03700 [Syntrophales bacterium]|nr:hypothetical protein [Syntrophales bacterium]
MFYGTDGCTRVTLVIWTKKDTFLSLIEKKTSSSRGVENISPRLLEEVHYSCYTQVAEAAAVGMPDPVYGEEIRYFLTLKLQAMVTVGDLKA